MASERSYRQKTLQLVPHIVVLDDAPVTESDREQPAEGQEDDAPSPTSPVGQCPLHRYHKLYTQPPC